MVSRTRSRTNMCSVSHGDRGFIFKGMAWRCSVSRGKGQIATFYPGTTKNILDTWLISTECLKC